MENTKSRISESFDQESRESLKQIAQLAKVLTKNVRINKNS